MTWLAWSTLEVNGLKSSDVNLVLSSTPEKMVLLINQLSSDIFCRRWIIVYNWHNHATASPLSFHWRSHTNRVLLVAKCPRDGDNNKIHHISTARVRFARGVTSSTIRANVAFATLPVTHVNIKYVILILS